MQDRVGVRYWSRALAPSVLITAGGSTVRGLAINRFGGAGIRINTGSNGNTIRHSMPSRSQLSLKTA